MSATDSKRIAKNTAFLYFRMILVMAVSLYTSRIVLEELGVVDFGINNVVGGVVAMMSFLNSGMQSSTQRYLNFESVRDNGYRLSDVFSTSLTIHAIILLIVLFIAETGGLWFVNAKLDIPPDRMFAANVIYQAAILSFCVTIMQIPYNSAIIAHEEMSIYAYISIIEVVLKLGIAFMLILFTGDKLIWFGILLFAVHLIIGILYMVYSIRRYDECSFRLRFNRRIMREMSGFAGWNLFGCLASLIRNQGLGIILNLFFGPVVNAAKGISDQINGAVNQFNSSFQTAMNPQITKNYAQGDIIEMEKLAYRGIKFSCIMLLLPILPIVLNVNYILNIWLTVVPEYTAIFVVLILADLLTGNLFGTPLMTSMTSTGKVRTYQLTISMIWLMILPVSYIMLRLGMQPESVFYANIALNLMAGITRLQFCIHRIGFHNAVYFRYVFFPVINLIIIAVGIMIPLKCYFFNGECAPDFIFLTLISAVCTAVVAWFVTLNNAERGYVRNFISKKLKR